MPWKPYLPKTTVSREYPALTVWQSVSSTFFLFAVKPVKYFASTREQQCPSLRAWSHCPLITGIWPFGCINWYNIKDVLWIRKIEVFRGHVYWLFVLCDKCLILAWFFRQVYMIGKTTVCQQYVFHLMPLCFVVGTVKYSYLPAKLQFHICPSVLCSCRNSRDVKCSCVPLSLCNTNAFP